MYINEIFYVLYSHMLYLFNWNCFRNTIYLMRLHKLKISVLLIRIKLSIQLNSIFSIGMYVGYVGNFRNFSIQHYVQSLTIRLLSVSYIATHAHTHSFIEWWLRRWQNVCNSITSTFMWQRASKLCCLIMFFSPHSRQDDKLLWKRAWKTFILIINLQQSNIYYTQNELFRLFEKFLSRKQGYIFFYYHFRY